MGCFFCIRSFIEGNIGPDHCACGCCGGCALFLGDLGTSSKGPGHLGEKSTLGTEDHQSGCKSRGSSSECHTNHVHLTACKRHIPVPVIVHIQIGSKYHWKIIYLPSVVRVDLSAVLRVEESEQILNCVQSVSECNQFAWKGVKARRFENCGTTSLMWGMSWKWCTELIFLMNIFKSV